MINKKNENGMILVALIGLMTAFAIIGIALFSYVTSQYSQTRRNVFIANAAQAAEAGIEQTLYEINQNETFSGYNTEQIFFDNSAQGKGVFTTVIESAGDDNSKTITSTAKVYRQTNLNQPVSTRRIKVTIVGTNSEGYSVFTGPGGLNLSGSANITNSDVYVNGKIALSGSAKIGTSSQPLNVNVAHSACPPGTNPGPTYPQVCTTGQPISFSGSSKIYGSVCATGQTNSSNILTGSGGQGLISGCVAPPVSTPTYDRSAHIAAVTTTGSASNSLYECKGSSTKTWPSNLKLTGDVNLGGSCKLTITGNVYITGNLDLGGSTKVTIADSVGSNRPVIIVDGIISNGGSARVIANSSGTGAHFISFKSTAACSPNCTSVTGTDLKNSQSLETVDIGGSASMPGMIFQSYWGKISLGGSGNMGAAIGQTIDLSGSGAVTFGTILSSGDRTWTVTSYQRVFN